MIGVGEEKEKGREEGEKKGVRERQRASCKKETAVSERKKC